MLRRGITLLGIALLFSSCTLSPGAPSAPSLIVTATLNPTLRPTLDALAQTTVHTTVQTTVQAAAPHTATATLPVLEVEPSATPPQTLIPAASPTLVPTLTLLPSETPADKPAATPTEPDIDATVEALLAATNAALAMTASPTPRPTLTPIPTFTVSATMTPPPSLTPVPTTIPPTRTQPGPPPLMPINDGSGTLIPGTGGETISIASIAGVDALPETLYYLSDYGATRQVFRLQVGMSFPEQLTFSPAGVLLFDVAPDGTLAYVTRDGDMVIGGIPFLPTANPDGTIPQVWGLAWSPDGNWLAYALYTIAAWNNPGEQPVDGLWLRNTMSGTTSRLQPNVYATDQTARAFQGPLTWRPDGGEILATGTFGTTQSYSRVTISTGVVAPVPYSETLDSADPVGAGWSVDGSAIIASGGGQILRVDPDVATAQILLDRSLGFHPRSARQFTGGLVMFANVADSGAAQLYAIPAGSNVPVAITDTLTTTGREVDFLPETAGQQTLVVVYELAESLGTPYWFDTNGTQHDLTPLTGPIASPLWGPLFKPGDPARVHTTEGDPLNVRATPGGNLVVSLVNGARVTILDGPREQGGYRWWHIQTPNGLTGWAVEAVPDSRGGMLRTLLPSPM